MSVISSFNVVSVMVGFSFLTWVLLSYLHKILSRKSIKWNDTEMVDIPGPVSPMLIALVSRYVCNDIREIT